MHHGSLINCFVTISFSISRETSDRVVIVGEQRDFSERKNKHIKLLDSLHSYAVNMKLPVVNLA